VAGPVTYRGHGSQGAEPARKRITLDSVGGNLNLTINSASLFIISLCASVFLSNEINILKINEKNSKRMVILVLEPLFHRQKSASKRNRYLNRY